MSSRATAGPLSSNIVSGGPEDFFDIIGNITAAVTNSGDVAGAEVAQLYLHSPETAPNQPPKKLRGFAKLPLEPGESGTAVFNIRKRDLAVWDTDGKQWTIPLGLHSVDVGSSSRDIRLVGFIEVLSPRAG